MKNIIISIFLFLSSIICIAQSYTIPLEKGPDSRLLYTTIEINGHKLHNCIIDTGSSTTFLTYDDYIYCLRNNLISEKDFINNATANKVGHKISYKKYKISRLVIGDLVIQNVVVSFDTTNRKSYRLVGADILNMFDYIKISKKLNIIYLEK